MNKGPNLFKFDYTVIAKSKTSRLKSSKNYKKKYRGQGRV